MLGEEAEDHLRRVDLLGRVQRAGSGVRAGPGVTPVFDRVERDRGSVDAAQPHLQLHLGTERAVRRCRIAPIDAYTRRGS